MKRSPVLRILCLCPAAFVLLLLCLAAPATAGAGEDRSKAFIDFLIREFSPETMTVILSEDPDEDGNIRDVYADARGCIIGKVRIDALCMRATGVTLTPPSQWAKDGINIRQILNVHAQATISETDLNNHLIGREFGDDDRWKNVRVDITPQGIYAKGHYLFKLLFTMDLFIEVFSKLRIVDRQQVWLDDYSVRVNRADVPRFIVDSAVGQIQPILDLKRSAFPMRLQTVTYDDENIYASSRILPEPFEGRTFHFPCQQEAGYNKKP